MERDGVILAVAEASLRYQAPAHYDDLIRVTTTLSEVKSRTMTFDYVIAHAESGTPLATARTLLVSIDEAGRATALPMTVRARLCEALR